MKDFDAPGFEYKVTVKNGAAWRNYKVCRLQISVGQPAHEGAKFDAAVRWVSSRFEHVIICINDTLQRHNSFFQHDMNEAEGVKFWKEEGKLWKDRNMHLIEALPSCTLHHWDEWKLRRSYNEKRQDVDKFYHSNKSFSGAIEDNIRSFWERNREKFATGESSFEQFAFFSREYLLEETAVFSIMFEETEAVDIYPGSVLLPAVIFRNNPVPGMPKGLDKGAFTRIDFRRVLEASHGDSKAA